MRNNAERERFARDPENWTVTCELYNMPRLRVSYLEYGGKRWYKIEIWKTGEIYSHKNFRIEMVTDWHQIGIYEELKEYESFGRSVSIGTIVEAMKDFDKEERKK